MKRRWPFRLAVLGVAIVVLVVGLVLLGYHRGRVRRNRLYVPARRVNLTAPPAPVPGSSPESSPGSLPESPQESIVRPLVLPPRGSLAAALSGAGVDAATVAGLLEAARPLYNLGHVVAGHRLTLTFSPPGVLAALTYEIGAGRGLALTRAAGGDGWTARVVVSPVDTRIVSVGGTVQTSLIGAVEAAGEGDDLGLALANVFGWQLDFYTDPRPGDTFRALVEKRYLDGRFSGYGDLLAAEYVNAGRAYRAVRFTDAGGAPAYYQPDGTPLKRMFLRSPLKFQARVTSGFSLSRLHPILKVYRAHLGVDYAAPMGAPVQSIGGGVVVKAGYFGGDGNMVQIRHGQGYETLYLHLSRILVHVGQAVAQGQQIGAVGMTGLATGPHLDFRIEHNGTFEDFEALRRKLPPDDPVGSQRWSRFVAVRDRALAQMQGTPPPSGR